MDVLTIENCFLKQKGTEAPITMKLASEGIAIKPKEGKVLAIKKEDIGDVEIFRGKLGICMRLFALDMFTIHGISDNYIDILKKTFSSWYKINLYLKETEISNVNYGDLEINKNYIEFRNEKTIFDIPLKDVEGVIDIRNEISLKFNNAEVRFISDKDTINNIMDRCSNNVEDSIFSFTEMTVVYPRGKNNIVLYKDHFRIIGYSYDHKIHYKNVEEIYNLEKNYIEQNDKYVVISLETPIRQGQTLYSSLVFSFDDQEEDIEISDTRLESRYSGLVSDIFTRIFETLCEKRSYRSNYVSHDNSRSVKCVTKAYEGQLYPLDKCLLFLPRAIKIYTSDIFSVEFNRIYISSMHAKTFDMTIHSSTQIAFNGINKEEFGQLEKYFNDQKIVIKSEVIDEVISTDESEEDNSSFVVEDEE